MADAKDTPKDTAKDEVSARLHELQATFIKADEEVNAARRVLYDKMHTAYEKLQEFTANRDRYYTQIINAQIKKVVALEAENASLRIKRPDNIATEASK